MEKPGVAFFNNAFLQQNVRAGPVLQAETGSVPHSRAERSRPPSHLHSPARRCARRPFVAVTSGGRAARRWAGRVARCRLAPPQPRAMTSAAHVAAGPGCGLAPLSSPRPSGSRHAAVRRAMRVQLERCCGEWRELDEEFRQLQVRRGPGRLTALPVGVPSPAGVGAKRGRSAAGSGVPRPSEGRRLLSRRSGVERGETAVFAPGPACRSAPCCWRPLAGGAAAEEE